jgi:hypothetical protein
LISRIKSTLSLYAKTHPLHAMPRRFTSDRGRVYTAIAGTAAVAGVCTAGAVVGPAPTAETAAHLATMAYTGPVTPGGPAEDSLFQTALGPSSTGHGGTVGQNHGPAGQSPAGSGQSALQAAPSQPYTIYDSVDPSAVPVGQPVATYVDGPFAVSSSQVAGHPSVLWIDTNGSDPKAASALDVEPGDATPAGAAQWVQQKLSASPKSTAVIYTMLSEWPQVQSYISTLPSSMQSHVKYWIADPTGTPHMVPGASATQWYWGNSYDISTAQPGF